MHTLGLQSQTGREQGKAGEYKQEGTKPGVGHKQSGNTQDTKKWLRAVEGNEQSGKTHPQEALTAPLTATVRGDSLTMHRVINTFHIGICCFKLSSF